MNNLSKINKPWVDAEGNALQPSALKKYSTSWTPATWEAYLQTLESPLRETLLTQRKINSLSEKSQCAILQTTKGDHQQSSLTLRDKAQLVKALNELSLTEKTIIRKLFWQKLSEREVAETLKISRSSVRVHYQRALEKLRTKVSPKKHIVRGHFSAATEKCPARTKEHPRPFSKILPKRSAGEDV